jgi:hypothetical protein
MTLDQPHPVARLWPAHSYPVGQEALTFPALWGRERDMVLFLIEWVHRQVRKIAPDEKWLRERYMRRSVLEVLAEGTTFCWAPCPERTFVASSVLAAHGLRHRLVLHERQVQGAGPPAAHMAIELELDGETHWFDFSRWESKFYAGAYAFRTDIERTISLQRVDMPFGEEMLATSPSDLARLVTLKETDWDSKVEWFVGDLAAIDDRVLEDRIIFSNAASRYEKPPPRAWHGPAAIKRRDARP